MLGNSLLLHQARSSPLTSKRWDQAITAWFLSQKIRTKQQKPCTANQRAKQRNIQLTKSNFKEQTSAYVRLITNNTWMKARQALQNDVIKLTADFIFRRQKMAITAGDKGWKQRLGVLLNNKLRFMPHCGAHWIEFIHIAHYINANQ